MHGIRISYLSAAKKAKPVQENPTGKMPVGPTARMAVPQSSGQPTKAFGLQLFR
jgi:hypothetical protein